MTLRQGGRSHAAISTTATMRGHQQVGVTMEAPTFATRGRPVVRMAVGPVVVRLEDHAALRSWLEVLRRLRALDDLVQQAVESEAV